MQTFTFGRTGLVALSLLVGSCGLSAPQIQEIWDGPEGARQIEFEIKRRVYCELKRGIIKANKDNSFANFDPQTGRGIKRQFIPDDWGVLVSLALQVDESSSLNPGLSLNRVFENAVTRFPSGNVTSGQSFSFGFGGTFSSTATRVDKFDAFYTVSFLMRPETRTSVCHAENDPFVRAGQQPAKSSPLIVSYLGIDKWLVDSMFTNSLLPSDEPTKAPKATDTVTYEAKFVIVSNGNVNPTWRMVRFTGNAGNAPLFGAGRTRTHSLIVTLGPQKGSTSQTHFASQLGQAFSVGNRSLLPP